MLDEKDFHLYEYVDESPVQSISNVSFNAGSCFRNFVDGYEIERPTEDR